MKKLFIVLITLLSIGITQAQVEFKSVRIGSQTWMKENLNVSIFRNGDPVPQAKTADEWKKAYEDGTPAWCYFNNDPSNGAQYGKLYNGYALSDARGLSPAGWHIPTKDEFFTLIDYLGGMKQAGLKLLVPGQFGGTNTSGFFGQLASVRQWKGNFEDIGMGTFFGTSTIERAGRSYYMILNFLGDIEIASGNWGSGISIRCIKDAKPVIENPNPVTKSPVEKKPITIKPPTSNGTSKAPAKLTSVKIGKQIWMVKNLDVATYRNGDPIPNVTDNKAWSELKTGAYCYFKNDSATYAATYGKIYNWYAVNDQRGLAPAGWHVPNDDEWTTLINYLGGEKVAGGKMKEKGATHWAGLPGGWRSYDGSFNDLKKFTYWWSSKAINTYYAWQLGLYFSGGYPTLDDAFLIYGSYVRCLRD